MPLFRFACSQCGRLARTIAGDAPAALGKVGTSCECGGEMRRAPRPPSSTVFEHLDNGWMARPVDRPAEAERLYQERSDADPLREK